MSLISDAEFAAFRADLETTLTHRCTITPVTSGAADEWGNETATLGTPVTNVPCTFEVRNVVARDEGGVTVVSVPTLTVSATTAIAIGSRVSAITDQLGGELAAGAFRVERPLDLTAGLGASLLPVWELRGTDVVRAT